MFKKIHNLFLLIHHEYDEVFGVPVEVDALDHQVIHYTKQNIHFPFRGSKLIMVSILEMPFVVKLLRILFIYFTKQRLNNYNDKHDTMIS